jgi:hypothetical protein
MLTEILIEEIVAVFGYTTESLNCANVYTAIGEIYNEDYFDNPMAFILGFIGNCTEEEFIRIKREYNAR